MEAYLPITAMQCVVGAQGSVVVEKEGARSISSSLERGRSLAGARLRDGEVCLIRELGLN
jgi:hypothetical protein